MGTSCSLRSAAPGLILAAFLLGAKATDAQVTGGSTCMDSTTAPILVYNQIDSRPVGHASVHKPSPDVGYAHAIFSPIPNTAVYRDILRIGGVLKLNGYAITRNGERYEHWIISLQGQSISHVRDTLAERFCSLFFNVEPYIFEDKLTPKIAGLVPFDMWDQYDSTTGRLRATVRFFGDVAPGVGDSLIQAYFGIQDSLDYYPANTVVATRQQLMDFAKESAVRSVYENGILLIPNVRPGQAAPHVTRPDAGGLMRYFDLLGRRFRVVR